MTFSRTITLMLLALVAVPAYASTLHVVPVGEEAGAGQSIVLSVRLEVDETVNTVSGSVRIPDGVVIDRIDTGGSALTLWMQHPTYVIADSAVEFLGGVPNGIAAGSDVLLFTLHAHARNPGSYAFVPSEVFAYLNDGEGTRVSVASETGSVRVDDSTLAQRAPVREGSSELVIDIGQDKALHDGNYFIAFFGGDTGKGIDHYEVREGWWQPPVRVDGTYVLRDQKLHSTIWVSAVAHDGSYVTKVIPAKNVDGIAIVSIIGLILAAYLLYCLFSMRRRHHTT